MRVQITFETSDVPKLPSFGSKVPTHTSGWDTNKVVTNRKVEFVSRKVPWSSILLCFESRRTFQNARRPWYIHHLHALNVGCCGTFHVSECRLVCASAHNFGDVDRSETSNVRIRYVGVIRFNFHVLQLPLIRFAQHQLFCISKSATNHKNHQKSHPPWCS